MSEDLEKLAVDQPSTAMSLLRPGVGAVDVDGGEAFRLQTSGEQPACFDAHDSDIADASFIELGAGFQTALIVNVDRQEIEDEVSNPATDFQGKGVVVAEHLSPVRRTFQLPVGDKVRR